MPKYLVKWPEELVWTAWIAALAVLVGAVMKVAGVDNTIIVATDGFILATGRLITGSILPTPTLKQEVASVVKEMTDVPVDDNLNVEVPETDKT